MEKDKKTTSLQTSKPAKAHFQEKKEVESNKAGSPDQSKKLKTKGDSAKNSK